MGRNCNILWCSPEKLHQMSESTACIYGLPKIRRDGIPHRPFVSSINSTTYNIAKHFSTVLAPLVGNTPHYINNSTNFTGKIQDLNLELDEAMVSLDVTSLFTCIPTTEAVKTVRRRQIQDQFLSERTGLTPAYLQIVGPLSHHHLLSLSKKFFSVSSY